MWWNIKGVDIMTVMAKKLGQLILDTNPSVLVTGISNGTTEITSIWLINNSTNAGKVSIYAHGIDSNIENMLTQIFLDANGGNYLLKLNGAPIILAPGETLRLTQEEGMNVTTTVYGIEEGA
jgi:hypothetical protein